MSSDEHTDSFRENKAEEAGKKTNEHYERQQPIELELCV